MSTLKQLNSRVVYQNPWMKVREDRIQRPSGAEGIYGVVDKPDFAVIIPLQNNQIHLVEQFRYPVNQRYWELPQGAWETEPDADPLELAKGELREETGLVAGSMVYVGFQYLAYGFCSQGYHIFLATELVQQSACLDSEEEDLVSRAFGLDEFEQMLVSGEIKDATTANAYGLAKLKGLL